jgi:hypothetical protein
MVLIKIDYTDKKRIGKVMNKPEKNHFSFPGFLAYVVALLFCSISLSPSVLSVLIRVISGFLHRVLFRNDRRQFKKRPDDP